MGRIRREGGTWHGAILLPVALVLPVIGKIRPHTREEEKTITATARMKNDEGIMNASVNAIVVMTTTIAPTVVVRPLLTAILVVDIEIVLPDETTADDHAHPAPNVIAPAATALPPLLLPTLPHPPARPRQKHLQSPANPPSILRASGPSSQPLKRQSRKRRKPFWALRARPQWMALLLRAVNQQWKPQKLRNWRYVWQRNDSSPGPWHLFLPWVKVRRVGSQPNKCWLWE